jgi:uncharacterized OsmC-like protein
VALISVTRCSGPVFDIRVGDHVVKCDLSGEQAASPAELLAGALGACVAMSVQDRCDRLGHVDGAVEVNLTMELADAPRRIARIIADVQLPRDVPREQVERIRRIAEHCVIHESLLNPIQLDIDFD